MKRLLVMHGPNFNRLGKRDASHYGELTLPKLEAFIASQGFFDYDFFQSNHEGALIDRLEQDDYDAILLNFGAYTHTSIALRDQLEVINVPKVEVHLSNIETRESFRRINYMKDVVDITIMGKKEKGYLDAIDYLKNLFSVV